MPKEHYLPDRHSEDDEDELERFMELTEEEADAEVVSAMNEFEKFVNSLSPIENYRYWRNFLLTAIMANRRRLRDPKMNNIECISDTWRKGIRHYQLSLVKHRLLLKTGEWPGSA